MGFLDSLLTEEHKKKKVAIQIGLKSGLFEECPICHDVTEASSNADNQATADHLIREFISSNKPEVALFNANEDELREMIIKVAKKLPYQCICHDY